MPSEKFSMQKKLVCISFMLGISLLANAQKDTTHSVIEEEPLITVTSYLSNVKSKQFPQPINVVTKNILLTTSATNIVESLSKTVPGFSAVSTGPAIAKPFIRGLGYNRVVTVNDGIRQEGQQWGDEHGIEIDDYNIQKAEILKGPASLMYGSDALAGVINLQSQKDAQEGSIKTNILSEYQTNNKLRGFYGNVAGAKNGFTFNLYGSYKGAQDYKNKLDGHVFNSKFYNQSAGGMLGYNRKKGFNKIIVSNFQQHIGMTEGERDETGTFIKEMHDGHPHLATAADFNKITPFEPFQKINHFKISSLNNFEIGKGNIDLIFAWQKNDRQEFGHAHEGHDHDNHTENSSTPAAHFALQTFNYNLFYKLPYFNNWRITVGTNGMWQNNKNMAEEKIIPNYFLFDAGMFVYTQYIVKDFTLSGGLRYDLRNVEGKNTLDEDTYLKFQAFNKSFGNFSGSIGTTYDLSENVFLKANVAKGFRAPNLAELASNGAHEGTFRYEVGNNDLQSEKSLQFDAGIGVRASHLSLNASVYYNTIKDFIFYERIKNIHGSDSIIIDEESKREISVFKFNQHDVRIYGVEVSIDIHPHPFDWLHFENIFSYVKATFTKPVDGSVNVPYIPAARWISLLKADVPVKEKVISNLQAGIESDYNFAQNNAFTGYNTETKTPAYWLFNSFVSFDVSNRQHKLFSVYLTANNILDVAYQNHLSRLKYAPVNPYNNRQGIFAMGRNFGIKVNIPLTFSWK